MEESIEYCAVNPVFTPNNTTIKYSISFEDCVALFKSYESKMIKHIQKDKAKKENLRKERKLWV